ncbi:MAG: C13 family peptidase, partial [Promethearchaeota archaeon]
MKLKTFKKHQIAVIFLLTTLVLNVNLCFFISTRDEIPSERDQVQPIPDASFTYANIGVWFIIAGDREADHGGLEFIIKGCDQLYEILIGMGYDDDDIYYFAPEVEGYYQSPYAHARTTRDAIYWAITGWAANKLNGTQQGIGIYLFDHGGIDVLALPGPNLSPTVLDDALDILENKTNCGRSIIIYEGCHSGSFIDDLSQEDRIIITSTD